MTNHSGFYGFSIASIYPDMGNQVSQTLETVPDPEEQEELTAQEPTTKVKAPVSKSSKVSFWAVLIILVAGVFVFAKS